MKTRTHRTLPALVALTVLFFVLVLGATLLPISAADVTPAAATQITAQNLASFAEKGATEAHIGYYAIETLPHLYWYAQQVNGGDEQINAVLLADLTLNEKVLNADGTLIADTSALKLWVPINHSGYDGTFDGNGHVLRGFFTGNTVLKYDNDGRNALFGTVHAATICNLGIEDSYFGAPNQYKAASFIGSAGGSARLENCYSTATIRGSAYCAGLVGQSDAITIKNCYFAGKITADDYTSAAIISDLYDDGTLINCYYLEGCGLSTKRATAMTAAQLASGMLTVRLNGGVTDGTQAFYQTVGVGHPTLSGATVYASAPCVSQFSNDPAAISAIEHSVSTQWTFDDLNHWHTCVPCGEHFDVTPHTFNSTGACTSCEYQATFRILQRSGGTLYLGDDLVVLEKRLQSGDRVKLLRDCTNYGHLTIHSGVRDVMFDINGHIWNVYAVFYTSATVIDSSEGMQGAVDGIFSFYGSSGALVLRNLHFTSEDGLYLLYTGDPQYRILLDNVVFEHENPFPDVNCAGIIKNAHFKNGLSAPVAIETLLSPGAGLVDAEGNPITLTAGQSTLQGEFFVVSYAFSVTSAEGTTRYKSVAELNAALRNMSGNVTITLLCDTDGGGSELGVRGGTVAVLDLAGKHLQNACLSTYPDGTLTLTDSSEAKSGRYTQPFGVTGLSVTGTMILQGGYIDSNVVLSHESSALYIKGGEYAFLQIDLPAGAHVEITGGRFGKMALSQVVTLADVIPEGYLPYCEQGWISDLGGHEIAQLFEIRVHVHRNTTGKDETHHWVGCECGQLAEGESREEHQFDENGVCDVCGQSVAFRVEAKDGKILFFKTADALSAYVEDSNGGKITLLADTVELRLTFAIGGEWVIDLSGASVSLLEIISIYADLTLTDSSAPATGEVKKSVVLAQIFGGTLRVEGGYYSTCMLAYNSLYTLVTAEVVGGSFDDLTLYGGVGKVYVNGGVAKTLEIRLEKSGETEEIYADPPKINCFEITEKLVLEDETLALSQILHLPDCVTLTDGEGAPVTLPSNSNVYEGHLIFTHSNTHVGQGVKEADGDYHWEEYPCGMETEKVAHYGGTASCQYYPICEGCEQGYGELALHDFDEELVCRACKTTAKLVLSTPDSSTLYGDLANALAAAQRAERATLTLLCDVRGANGSVLVATLKAGNVTLDLAGFLLESDTIRITQSATLTVTDTSKEGTGKITANYAFDVLNGGTLIINGGEIHASSVAQNANVIVNGGTFTGEYGFDLYDGVTLVVNGGEFYCVAEEFYVGGGKPTMILRGGTFPEGLLIAGDSDHLRAITDVLPPFACFSFVDAEGNPITPEEGQMRYQSYIRVLHTESYTLQKDADVHYEVCVCGEKRNEQAHSGGTATCTEQAICETCGESYGALAEHEYDNACDGTCNVCGADTRTPAAHSGGTATCTEKAKCESCGVSYGELAAHTYDNDCDGKCNVCGADTRTPAAHKDANKDNKCDACGTAMQTGDTSAEEDGLSGGAVAAIVIGSVVALGGGGFALYWFVLRKKKVV